MLCSLSVLVFFSFCLGLLSTSRAESAICKYVDSGADFYEENGRTSDIGPVYQVSFSGNAQLEFYGQRTEAERGDTVQQVLRNVSIGVSLGGTLTRRTGYTSDDRAAKIGESDRFEYLELYNPDAAAFSLANYKVPAVNFTFPSTASIGPMAYVLLCRNKALLQAVYQGAPNADVSRCVFQDYEGGLDDGGEEVVLQDPQGTVVTAVPYDDKLPWEPTADGMGGSLELLCPASDPVDPRNWRASPLPVHWDPHVEWSGSPGRPSLQAQCPGWQLDPAPPVYLVEIHYHPVDEPGAEDDHEFVELLSQADGPVDLGNWRLQSADGLRFTFPADAVVPPGGRVVVAKNPTALQTVYTEGGGVTGQGALLFGPYAGELGNGGDKLALLDTNGRSVDYVAYNDKWPWPVGADELGDSPDRLPAPVAGDPGPLPNYNVPLRGLALQRRRLAHPGHEAYNWRAEGPSPGRAAPDDAARSVDGPVDAPAPGAMLPRPTDIDVWDAAAGASKGDPVRGGGGARLEVRVEPDDFASVALLGQIRVEWFTDDRFAGAQGAVQTTVMSRVAQPANPLHVRFECQLPAQPGNTVVRYRVVVEGAGGPQTGRQVAPRPRDPVRYFSLFHAPADALATDSRSYHMFVTRANWDRVIANAFLTRTTSTNCARGTRCCIEPRWSERVPVTLVVGNKKVVDAEMRLQGSRWNRDRGLDLTKQGVWGSVGPTGTFKAYSYRFTFPDYFRVDGRDIVILSAMKSPCTMVEAPIHYRLARAAGMIASSTRYVRLHANGHYFRYMLELTRGGDGSVDDFLDRQNHECWEHPTQRTGDLFKAQGLNTDTNEGPYGVADMRQLGTYCGYSPIERYEYTYGRKTNKKLGTHVQFKALLDGVNPANKFEGCTAQEAAWVEATFDINMMATYIAVNNYAGEWDAIWHNQFMYMRTEDNRWMWAPWDADYLYSDERPSCCSNGIRGSQESLWVGETIDQHRAKKAVSLCFRDLVKQRYRQFLDTIWQPAYTTALLDQLDQEFNQTEVSLQHGGFNNQASCMTKKRAWFPLRRQFVSSHQDLAGVGAGQPYSPCPQGLAKVTRQWTAYRAPPGQPSTPTATMSANAVSVRWGLPNGHGQPSAQATFEVQWAASEQALAAGAPQSTVISVPGAGTTSWQDPAPVAGRWYRVRATLGGQAGPWSAAVQVVQQQSMGGGAPTAAPPPTGGGGGGPMTNAPSPAPTPVPCPNLVAQCEQQCSALNQVLETCSCSPQTGLPEAGCRADQGQGTPPACVNLMVTCSTRCPNGYLQCGCDFTLGDAVATCIQAYTTPSPTPFNPNNVGGGGGGDPTATSDDDSMGPLIGGALGGIVVLLLLGCLVIACLSRRRKAAHQRALLSGYSGPASGGSAPAARQVNTGYNAQSGPYAASTGGGGGGGPPTSYGASGSGSYNAPSGPAPYTFGGGGGGTVQSSNSEFGRPRGVPRDQDVRGWNSPLASQRHSARRSRSATPLATPVPRPIPRPQAPPAALPARPLPPPNTTTTSSSSSVAVSYADANNQGHPCAVCGNLYASEQDLAFHKEKRGHF